jgi:predicted phosphohydrolase
MLMIFPVFSLINNNKLIVTSGWDSKIMVQSDTGKEAFRVQEKAHFNGEISRMRVSFLHNLVATSSEGIILIWNFDSFSLRGAC